MEKSFTKRLQELAGITEESKMISRIDQEIEKAKERRRLYGPMMMETILKQEVRSGMEFIGGVYQVPFEYDDDDEERMIIL